jgi:hypothetical protein
MSEPVCIERRVSLAVVTIDNPGKLNATIRAEIDLQPMLWLSDDHREGKAAVREKRKPRFSGT